MPLHQTLHRALLHRLQALANRHRARNPDAAIHTETISDTRGILRLWRWSNDSYDTTNREDDAP